MTAGSSSSSSGNGLKDKEIAKLKNELNVAMEIIRESGGKLGPSKTQLVQQAIADEEREEIDRETSAKFLEFVDIQIDDMSMGVSMKRNDYLEKVHNAKGCTKTLWQKGVQSTHCRRCWPGP